jgi:hypothetical protein
MARNKHTGEKTTSTKPERQNIKAVDRAIKAQERAAETGTKADARAVTAANQRHDETYAHYAKSITRWGRS